MCMLVLKSKIQAKIHAIIIWKIFKFFKNKNKHFMKNKNR